MNAKRRYQDLNPQSYHGKLQTYKCKVCGKKFYAPAWKRSPQYCSAACRQTGISRSSAALRGDRLRGRGEGKGYVKYHGRHLHRIVAETKIGRPLIKGEVVHHIDGNRFNNAADNLMITIQAKHACHHSTKNRTCGIPGCERKHKAKGLCNMHYRRKCKAAKGGD